MRRLLPLLPCVLVLAACGGGDGKSGVEEGGSKAGVAPVCEGQNRAVPKSFTGFPFPEGSVLTQSRLEEGATVVEGFVRDKSLAEVRDEVRDALPKAGYELLEGDAEEHEAETDFKGHAKYGHLKLRDDVCKDAVSFGVAVRSAS